MQVPLLVPCGRRKNGHPVVLHAYDRLTFCERLVERLIELSDRRVAVIGPLALGVGVMYEAHEAGGHCPQRSTAASDGRRQSCRRQEPAAGR